MRISFSLRMTSIPPDSVTSTAIRSAEPILLQLPICSLSFCLLILAPDIATPVNVGVEAIIIPCVFCVPTIQGRPDGYRTSTLPLAASQSDKQTSSCIGWSGRITADMILPLAKLEYYAGGRGAEIHCAAATRIPQQPGVTVQSARALKMSRQRRRPSDLVRDLKDPTWVRVGGV